MNDRIWFGMELALLGSKEETKGGENDEDRNVRFVSLAVLC